MPERCARHQLDQIGLVQHVIGRVEQAVRAFHGGRHGGFFGGAQKASVILIAESIGRRALYVGFLVSRKSNSTLQVICFLGAIQPGFGRLERVTEQPAHRNADDAGGPFPKIQQIFTRKEAFQTTSVLSLTMPFDVSGCHVGSAWLRLKETRSSAAGLNRFTCSRRPLQHALASGVGPFFWLWQRKNCSVFLTLERWNLVGRRIVDSLRQEGDDGGAPVAGVPPDDDFALARLATLLA